MTPAESPGPESRHVSRARDRPGPGQTAGPASPSTVPPHTPHSRHHNPTRHKPARCLQGHYRIILGDRQRCWRSTGGTSIGICDDTATVETPGARRQTAPAAGRPPAAVPEYEQYHLVSVLTGRRAPGRRWRASHTLPRRSSQNGSRATTKPNAEQAFSAASTWIRGHRNHQFHLPRGALTPESCMQRNDNGVARERANV